MHRFFTDTQGTMDGFAYLEEEDGRHALRVLRLTTGEEIVLLDGSNAWQGEIVDITNDQVKVKFVSPLPSTEPKLSITLYQGLPKGDKMDWIIQKGTEIGITSFVPVAMSRSIVQLNQKDGAKKQQRWQKIAREAAKQSGRCHVPKVALPMSFKQATNALCHHGQVLVPWEDAQGASILFARKDHPALDVGIVIGPEGGISPQEIECLQTLAAALPVTLGPRILRTETAGLAAACVLLTVSGDMA